MNKIQEEIIAEFDKEFPKCDCRNNMPPHFDDKFINREWIINFLLQSLQKVEDSVRKEVIEEMTEINLTFADSEEGDLQEGIRIGSELMKKDVLRIISKK